MSIIWTIAVREYKRYFASPAAYLIAFMILLVIGIFFYLTLQIALEQRAFVPGVDTVLGVLPTLLMLATPVVTARTIAEEGKLGTIELLLTSPVRDWELVIGKWLGSFMFMLTIVIVTIIYPIILHQLVDPGIDQGPLITGYLGLALMLAAMLAIGVFVSSLFTSQIAAFATTLGILIVLWWVINPIAQTIGVTGGYELIQYLDIRQHYFTNFLYGVIDLRDVTYYLGLTALGLFLGTLSVEVRRW